MNFQDDCEFIRSLNLNEGDKVLDVGCGSGDVAKFISDVVGQHGEVVGIDPEKENIKIANEKFKDVENLKFFVGDLSGRFPHQNEEYYDLVYSSSVFYWLKGKNKKHYLNKAYSCLIPGGRVCVATGTTEVDQEVTEIKQCKQFVDFGVFDNVQSGEIISNVSQFTSFKELDGLVMSKQVKGIEPEFQDWMAGFREKCKKKEQEGKLVLEFKELVRVTATT